MLIDSGLKKASTSVRKNARCLNMLGLQQISPGMSTAKYIHQIWWQGVGCIPKKYEKNRASWVENHPEWYYRLWDETSLTQLLKNHYSTFLPLLKRLTHMIQRVHLCKYILLYHFGGIAVDLDVLCNINLEPVLKDARLVLASRYEHVGRDQMLLQVSN